MGQAVVAALWNGKFLGWLTVDRGVHNKPITQAQLDILALYALMIGSMLASKHIEIALRESEEKFKLFTESAPISTFIMNTSGIIVLVNKETENLFGYARAELVGQSIEVLVPEDDKNSDSPLLSAFITMPTEQHSTDLYQCNVRRKDGSIFSANVKFSYIFNLPTPMVMSFVIDSTQRNLVEQSLKQALAHEKELVELKTRFVSVASHEFRTPLAAILATTETLTAYRKKMDEAQIDLRLDKIRLQVMHMKHIMEDVLQLARFQAGRVEAKLTPGDLEMLCQEIIEEYQSQEEFQGRIIYERSNSPLEFAFDSNLMRQIIGNLVSNGLKYSHKEKPVRVNLIQDSEQIVIKVQDEGIGIPSDDFKNLFEPFNRASNVGAISGTGLGLSIAKQSVELQNGIIIVDSQVGKGTTFTVIFPMREGSNG
jgi:PAS domain S-box-containing protein